MCIVYCAYKFNSSDSVLSVDWSIQQMLSEVSSVMACEFTCIEMAPSHSRFRTNCIDIYIVFLPYKTTWMYN